MKLKVRPSRLIVCTEVPWIACPKRPKNFVMTKIPTLNLGTGTGKYLNSVI